MIALFITFLCVKLLSTDRIIKLIFNPCDYLQDFRVWVHSSYRSIHSYMSACSTVISRLPNRLRSHLALEFCPKNFTICYHWFTILWKLKLRFKFPRFTSKCDHAIFNPFQYVDYLKTYTYFCVYSSIFCFFEFFIASVFQRLLTVSLTTTELIATPSTSKFMTDRFLPENKLIKV